LDENDQNIDPDAADIAKQELLVKEYWAQHAADIARQKLLADQRNAQNAAHISRQKRLANQRNAQKSTGPRIVKGGSTPAATR
jgi:hypothetical protein